jgi:hypothetical protein
MRTPLIALALLASAAAARADEPDLAKMADLEKLVRQVEADGFKRFPTESLRPRLPGEKLVFQVQGNTVEKEKEFRKAWIAEYAAIAKEAEEKAKAAAKEKKSPEAKEAKLLLLAIAPRFQELRALEAKPAEKETFDAREAALKKFLKRYDFGPKIAKASADGTAVINVQLAPDTYEVVRRAIYAWKFQPLKDPQGGEAKAGKRRIEFTEQLSQGDVREALRQLQNEFFVVRYAKWEKEKETDLIRVTGAKLLLGTYYFIEHEDRLIVAREPAAK